MQIGQLEFGKYLWYAISLAIFLAWLCRGGWKFQALESILFRPEKDDVEPERQDESEAPPVKLKPRTIPPDTPRAPHPGFELFDVLIVIFVYLMLDLVLIQVVGKDPNAAQDRPLRYFGGLFGKQILITVFIVLIVWQRFYGGLGHFGLGSRSGIRTLVRAAGFSFVAMGLTLLILEVTIIISAACGVHEIQRHTILELLAQNPPFRDKLLMSLTAAIGAPLQEEFIFRGVLQTFLIGLIFQELQRRKHSSGDEALSQRRAVWARWLGILAASGIFALMHLPNWQHLPALFALGMSLGYFYVRYGNLLIPIFVHSMFNILPLAYMMWQVGPRIL